MGTWIKDNGQEIELNDHPGNVDAAIALGWKRKEAKPAPKKRGSPKKEAE